MSIDTAHEPYPVQSDPDYTVTFEEIDGWRSNAWVIRYKGDLIEDMCVYDDEQDAWEAADDYRDRDLAYAETKVTRALDLRVGDRYVLTEHGRIVTVTILRRSEPCNEPFGRPGFFRYWAQRSDTDTHGWVSFGPKGFVRALPRNADTKGDGS